MSQNIQKLHSGINPSLFIGILNLEDIYHLAFYFNRFKLVIFILHSNFFEIRNISKFCKILIFYKSRVLKFEEFSKDGFTKINLENLRQETFSYMKNMKKKFQINIFKSISKSIEITFFSLSGQDFLNLKLKQIFLVISFWIYGYVILNFFNSKLYSFLTTLIYTPQIESFQDIIDRSLYIFVPFGIGFELGNKFRELERNFIPIPMENI